MGRLGYGITVVRTRSSGFEVTRVYTGTLRKEQTSVGSNWSSIAFCCTMLLFVEWNRMWTTLNSFYFESAYG